MPGTQARAAGRMKKEEGDMTRQRPSFALILDVDERLDSRELRLEVTRCYAHVASTVVRTHEASDGDPENVARILVKLGTRRYLRSSVEGADELWNATMAHWFESVLHKVGNNMVIFNRRQREIGRPELLFSWIEVALENGALSVLLHLDSNSGIDPACGALLTRMREALNAGALGEGVARVLMPSPESFAAQAERGAAAKAAREAAREAERAAAEAEVERAAAEAERAADEAFLESPELAARLSEGDGTDGEDEAAGAEADAQERFAVPEPDFAIDYGVWRVEYADGSACTYDSAAGTRSDGAATA